MTTRLSAALSVLMLFFATLLGACGGSSGLEIERAGAGGQSALGAAGEAGTAESSGGHAGRTATGAAGEAGAGELAAGGSAGRSGSSGAGGAPSAGGAFNAGGALNAGGASNSGGAAGSPNGGVAGTAGIAGAGGTASAALVSVAVTPAVASVAVGTQTALTATATYSDGSTRDVTATASWTSDPSMVAAVAGGVVTGNGAGTATIAATFDGRSGSAEITVPSATVTALTVTPVDPSTAIQGVVEFHAVVTLSDGTTQDVTQTATWSASDPSVASVSTSGLATGVAAGTSDIQASSGMVSGSTTLTVTSATLVSIAVTPTNPALGVGVAQEFTATGTFSDGSVSDVSDNATWTSSVAGVASIDAGSHVAKTLGAGTTTISASVGTIAGTTTLSVTQATLTAISVSPPSSTLAINGTADFTASGSYSDGSTADLTRTVTWSSSNPAVASASNAADSRGTVTGLGGGTSTVSATLGNVSGTASVTVTPAALVSLAISPSDPTLPLGTKVPLTAEGSYSDGSNVDVTRLVTWSSDTPSVAAVSNASGSQGEVTAGAVGTSGVHATLGSVSATTTVTVTAAELVSIALAPANPTLPAGTTQALTATGTYSDGSQADLTAQATWSSGTPGVASVSNAGGSRGTVTAVTTGTTTVTATFAGAAGSTLVTVSPPNLTQIVVSPIADSVLAGGTVTYTATAIYSNNTQTPLNRGVTWASSNTAVATLAAGRGGGPGAVIATAIAAGNTTISATYQGVAGSTTLTVTSATVTAIEVTPTDPVLSVNATRAMTATAIYSDATTRDVTANVTWVSSDPTVAAVATGGGGPGGGGAGGGRGTVTALGAGTATISATLGGLTGSTLVTVTAATLVSIEIMPAASNVAVGTAVAFTATAIYSDDTTQNVTPRATWISSVPNVASISTANGTRGQALALGAGSTDISATLDGVTGSTTLGVTSATLTNIQITPFSPTVPAGFNTNLTATGIYSDATTRDLTALATWTSSVTGVATVSDAGATRGALTPVGAGTTTIGATYQGVSGSDTVTVSSATLTSISVTPASASVSVHGTQAFSALGTLSDATTLDVTNFVTWFSATPAVANVSNAAGSRGVATGLSAGSATISAVRGNVTGSASLTVQ